MHIKYQEEGQIYKFSVTIISIRIRENRQTQKIPQKKGKKWRSVNIIRLLVQIFIKPAYFYLRLKC